MFEFEEPLRRIRASDTSPRRGPPACNRAPSTRAAGSGAPRGSCPGSAVEPVISPDQKWRIVPSRRVNTLRAGTSEPFGRIAEIVARIGAVEVAEETEVPPAALAFPGDQALDRRAGDDRKRDALADVGCIALPGAEGVGAHRARARALRPEHVAVDHQRLLVAEEAGEVGRAVLALEAIVADDRAARRQRPALRRDALDVTAQLDLLGEQRRAGGAILGAFVGYSHRVGAGEFDGRRESWTLAFMGSVSLDDRTSGPRAAQLEARPEGRAHRSAPRRLHFVTSSARAARTSRPGDRSPARSSDRRDLHRSVDDLAACGLHPLRPPRRSHRR